MYNYNQSIDVLPLYVHYYEGLPCSKLMCLSITYIKINSTSICAPVSALRFYFIFVVHHSLIDLYFTHQKLASLSLATSKFFSSITDIGLGDLRVWVSRKNA